MKLQRAVLTLAFSSILLAGSVGSAAAASNKSKSSNNSNSNSSSNASQNVATATGDGSVQSYDAESALQDGTIVQFAPKSTTIVTPATQKNASQMYGVTVDPSLLSLTVTNSKLAHEVFVANSGTYIALVSNQTGNIKSGDYVTISSIAGVGMDASTTATTVVGRAVGIFDGKNNVIGTEQLKDKSGQVIKNVSIGIIPIAIDIGRNPDEKSTQANLPKALQRVGSAVADKPVTGLRIYLGVAVLVASLIIAVVMLYSGIRSSMVAIGRNPLSKKIIFRGLLEIIMAAIVIVIVGLFAVYLLLKL